MIEIKRYKMGQHMTVLIYGHKGWIGNQFVELCQTHDVNYVLGNSRVDSEDRLIEEIDAIRPTHIVSLIGRTHGKIGDKEYTTIDYLEQPGKLRENIRDNLFSPLLLAMIAKEKDIHFTYLGTGCIFEYDDHHPFGREINGFTEESLPNFFGSSYSVVKGFTDRLMKYYEKNTLQLRIRMPITPHQNPRNFITKITNYKKICSIPNSMSVLSDLLPIMLQMMKDGKTGTYNFTNPGLVSHNEILEMYREIVDPSFVWENFTMEEQNQILDSKRSNNFLNTEKLEEAYPIPHIKDSIRNLLSTYKSSLESSSPSIV
jgi:3,5-epimerase/4-reductase